MSDNTEPIRVVFAQDEHDYQRNTVSVYEEIDGNLRFHRKMDLSKLIDGDDLIVEDKPPEMEPLI